MAGSEEEEAEYEENMTLMFVMAGLVPAIHVLNAERPKGVDARHKAGHDGRESVRLPHHSSPL